MKQQKSINHNRAMLKIFSVLGAVCMLAFNAAGAEQPAKAAAAAVKPLPLNWRAVKAKMTQDADKVISVSVEKGGGYIQCPLKFPKNRRLRAAAEVKGSGKWFLGFYGSAGWFYQYFTLNDKWQTVTAEYGEPFGNINFYVHSSGQGAADVQIRNISVTLIPLPELENEEIAPVLFKAVDHPGSNGKVTKEGMYGKRWYHIVKMPVPANSRPLYYYIRMKADGPVKTLYWMAKGQMTKAYSAEKANGKWAWVKTGPYSATVLSEEITLGFSDPKSGITVDKVALSTNGALTDKQLDALKLQ